MGEMGNVNATNYLGDLGIDRVVLLQWVVKSDM
jgi:hypothetical protein